MQVRGVTGSPNQHAQLQRKVEDSNPLSTKNKLHSTPPRLTLEYHASTKVGKISVQPIKSFSTSKDLSLAYTLGFDPRLYRSVVSTVEVTARKYEEISSDPKFRDAE